VDHVALVKKERRKKNFNKPPWIRKDRLVESSGSVQK